MRRICPFCQTAVDDIWQCWKTSKQFSATMASLCANCGEIILIDRDGIRKPTADEHIGLASDGGLKQARQLWLDAHNENAMEVLPILGVFRTLQQASQHSTSESHTLMIEGIYWRAAAAAYDSILQIFNEENYPLPQQLVERLEMLGALIKAGDEAIAKRIRALDLTERRKATSV